jgi:hypothetical protein
VAAEGPPQFVTEAEFRDTAEDEEAAATDDEQEDEGSAESNEPPESGGTQSSSGTAESIESVTKNNLIFVSLGGWALPAALNYERIFGKWTAGGGAFIMPTDRGTFVIFNARASRSLWSVGRSSLLASAGGAVALFDYDCHECSRGWGDPRYGLAVSVAFEHRGSLLLRLEFAVLWSTPDGLSNVELLGLPLVVAPGISVGFTF